MLAATNKAMAEAQRLHLNVGQDTLLITRDRVKLTLIENVSKLQADWKTSLGFFITFIIASVTTDFHDFILKADMWKGILIAADFITAGWFLKTVFWDRKKTITIDQLVDIMKQPINPDM